MSFVQELTWRGLVKQLSHEQLDALISASRTPVYAGFDPTAPSLHVGNLVPLIALRRAQRFGHRPVVLLGGATGMIGDPSGKAGERKLLTAEDLERNVKGLEPQLGRFVDLSDAVLVNNADWFQGLSYLSFLRDVGKHFSVNMMMAKDSVRARLEDRESGISYTEFSYMLIQAYDFLHLFDAHRCALQVGGSEQWGNITAGIELIRRLRGQEAYGLTLQLLVDAQGKKFGKTEDGAVWLDPERTPVYDFYQYFLRADDRDAGKLLRFLTLLDRPTIEEVEHEHARAPEKRTAQRLLARELTTLVHGPEATARAEEAAQALFGPRQPGTIPPGAPTHPVSRALLEQGWPLIEALVQSGLLSSKGEARREITGGGIYVNDVRIAAVDHRLGAADLQGDVVLLRRGKKNYLVLKAE